MSTKNYITGSSSGTVAAGDDSRFAQITQNTTDITTKAAKGANADITSLTGLTTAISIAQGGTGATSTSAARSNLGLGSAAVLNVGTASGTVAAGDDSRLVATTTNAANITKLTLSPTATKTTAYTASAQDLVICDATNATFNVTLPSAPSDGSIVEVKKIDSSTNTVTVSVSGSDVFMTGSSTTLTLALQGHAVTWRYQSSSAKWIALTNDLPLTSTDGRYLTQASASNIYSTAIGPTAHGFSAWTFDPFLSNATQASSPGYIRFTKTKTALSGTVSSVMTEITTAGGSLTLAKIGIYDSSGTLLGSTADQSADWNVNTGIKTIPLVTATRTLILGETLYLALICVGSTGATTRAWSSGAGGIMNIGTTAAGGYRVGYITGQTDLASTLNFASTTSTGTSHFIGIK